MYIMYHYVLELQHPVLPFRQSNLLGRQGEIYPNFIFFFTQSCRPLVLHLVRSTHSFFLRRVNKKNKNTVSATALAALFHKALAKSLFQRLRDFPLTLAVTGSHTTSRFRKTIDGLSALFMKTLELKWSWKRTKCATFLHGFCQRQNSSQQGRCRYLLVH